MLRAEVGYSSLPANFHLQVGKVQVALWILCFRKLTKSKITFFVKAVATCSANATGIRATIFFPRSCLNPNEILRWTNIIPNKLHLLGSTLVCFIPINLNWNHRAKVGQEKRADFLVGFGDMCNNSWYIAVHFNVTHTPQADLCTCSNINIARAGERIDYSELEFGSQLNDAFSALKLICWLHANGMCI